MTKNNFKKKVILSVIAVLALNVTAIGIWSANSGKITSSADITPGEKYINVPINSANLSSSSGVKTQSNSTVLAKPVAIDLDNPVFSENIVVDDGSSWDLNLVGGGSLLPLNSQVTHKFTYGQNDGNENFTQLTVTNNNSIVANSLSPVLINNKTYYFNANESIYYDDQTKAVPLVKECTQAIVDQSGKSVNTVNDKTFGKLTIAKGTSPNGCQNTIIVEQGNFQSFILPNGFNESVSLNQKFIDSENSTQYGFMVKLKVNSGKAIIGLSSDSRTAYSEIIESSDTAQSVNVMWRDLAEKPNRVFVGLVDNSFDINLYSAYLYRPVVSSITTKSIGGSNIEKFTQLAPQEKYFYYPANQSFETKVASASNKILYWYGATTNFDVPPPPPSGVSTSTTSGGPPPPPPPPGGTTTTSPDGPPPPPLPPSGSTTTTAVSGQGSSGPPPPPAIPGTSFLIDKAQAQSTGYASNAINLPTIKINETADTNNVVQGVSDGKRSLYFKSTNAVSTNNSFLIDFVYQKLGSNFTDNYNTYPDFSYELNADIKVVKGKIVAGMANSTDTKNKIKLSSAISPSDQIQHLILPITNQDIETNTYDMIVAGSVQGLAEFYLDNVYLKITDNKYNNTIVYLKYRFSGTTDNLNWDLANWSSFEKPLGEKRSVAINSADDVADGSQYLRVQSALYSEDPYYVPGIESFDLYFTELTSPITTTTEVGQTTTTAINGVTTTTEPVIPPVNPQTPEVKIPFSKLVSTGGVLWVNLLISMLLSALVTWLIFRKKKIIPTQPQ